MDEELSTKTKANPASPASQLAALKSLKLKAKYIGVKPGSGGIKTINTILKDHSDSLL